MKSVVRWSPEPKLGKQPGRDDIVECKEQPPVCRLAAIAAVGGLTLIGLTNAVLAISGARPKKSVARKLDTAEFKAQNMRQGAVDVGPTAANIKPPARSTSGYPSSVPRR
jgi:hypothetical protein